MKMNIKSKLVEMSLFISLPQQLEIIYKNCDLLYPLNKHLPQPTRLMSNQIVPFSARKTESLKAARNPREFGSHISNSDMYVSTSKSNKLLGESLRKPESINKKSEKSASPLGQRLNFGKFEQEKTNKSQPTYFVDITKKIKKVSSPFQHCNSASETKENKQLYENRMLVSSFDSFSENFEDQVESSNCIQKIASENQEIEFKNLAVQVEQVLQDKKFESQKICLNSDLNHQIIEQQSEQKSSSSLSSKSKSSDTIRLRKKEKKIRKREKKKMIVKQMTEKLKTITEFVDELHRKESHTKRKDRVQELRNHLCEDKFGRLRNELKKLI